MKLLIVEDSARLSAALTSDFRGEGFAVDHAGDGQAALWQIGAHEYDVMILDLMLPRVSGLEVLRALRASRSPTRVLVIRGREGSSSQAEDCWGRSGVTEAAGSRERGRHRTAARPVRRPSDL